MISPSDRAVVSSDGHAMEVLVGNQLRHGRAVV
jgi:hypothetical protein